MTPMRTLVTIYFMLLTVVGAFAQSAVDGANIRLGSEMLPSDTTKSFRLKNHLIAPRGEWQCGLSVMYADISSSDSDIMMLLQGLNAQASILRLAPEAAYTYAENKAVGARFQYTNIDGMVDAASADLLGNLTVSFENVNASSRSMSGSVFHRTYVGLESKGRVGIFWDYVLGFTRSKTVFAMGAPSTYSISNKFHLGFAPGLVYFPMNNLSVQASICLADVSYSSVKAYESRVLSGQRQQWKAQASISILDINFGLTIHL